MVRILTVILAVAIAVLCLLWVSAPDGSAPVLPAPRDAAPGRAETVLAAGAPAEETRRGLGQTPVAQEPAPAGAAAPALSLLERLARIATAHETGDARELERLLELLLFSEQDLRAVLTMLRGGELAADGPERRGALLTLAVVVVRGARDEPPLAFDGRGLALDVLRALPALDDAARERLVELIAGSGADGRRALDARCLSTLVALARAHPEHEDQWAALIGGIDHDGARLAEHADLLFEALDLARGPRLVGVCLAALLLADAPGTLTAAEQLYRSPRADGELRQALANALCTHAPVRAAAESLARLEDRTQIGALAILGAREGGLEALRERYGALLTDGLSPRGRRALVSGMQQERQDVLLGLASTDPDRSVREQAWLTLTSSHKADDATLQALLSGAHGISARARASAAANALQHAEGSQRAQLAALLADLARDTRQTGKDRAYAQQRLAATLSAAELAALGLGADPPPR